MIQPIEDASLPRLFMLTDQKIRETKPRDVTFKLAYWKDKWPYGKLVE